ncbi:unnamed protein product [Scytosiphon promiscuus]
MGVSAVLSASAIALYWLGVRGQDNPDCNNLGLAYERENGFEDNCKVACDDVDLYFADVSTSTEIDLEGVASLECPDNVDGEVIAGVTVESGKTLTIKSSEAVRFVNVRFTVEAGASLVFDMPATEIGPNSGDFDNPRAMVFDLYDDSTLTFMGDFHGDGVENVRTMFYSTGSIEFKGDALFENNGNVFRSNLGTIKFRGDTVFRNNFYLALDNEGTDSFVRFSKTATFEDNAGSFDGSRGCAVINEGTASFRGVTVFDDHICDGGKAVYNEGKMSFYGKTRFNNNNGGLRNSDGGDLAFKAAVQFNTNIAEVGGGLLVDGGDVEFKKGVTFDGNSAVESGGAFAVTDNGSLTFKKPWVVRTRNNVLVGVYSSPTPVETTGCSLAYIEDGATVTGFDVDDACEEVTVTRETSDTCVIFGNC